MLKKGIKLQYHYIPLYRQTYLKKMYKVDKRNFKNMENYFNNSISLPIYVGLKKKDLIRITNEIKKFFNN